MARVEPARWVKVSPVREEALLWPGIGLDTAKALAHTGESGDLRICKVIQSAGGDHCMTFT